ncbi:hypothetical protein DMB91_05110 [Campylobacter sp. MIT 97-5078]|nr:hypothetical protein LR59_06155 [Campylobacter sp. MIT 97-5078]TQR27142.1 hypothetical protein DMB91_05110 [Campylobacter sp. MIT 97-5078]
MQPTLKKERVCNRLKVCQAHKKSRITRLHHRLVKQGLKKPLKDPEWKFKEDKGCSGPLRSFYQLFKISLNFSFHFASQKNI